MKKNIKAGATDQTLDIFVQDSSLTTGAGLTGLVFNTASLVCYYRKGATGTPTALTLATQTVGGAHSDGGFVAVDGTNMPGVYRLDLSDTIVATAGSVSIMLRGAANMAPVTIELQVVAYNPEDAVRLGLTALPNAAADAAGGLPISDAGGLDLDARLDAAVTSRASAAALATAQADLDTITGADGATLATAQALYAPSKAGDAMALTSGERATLAAAIWNALTSGMSTVGSIGKKLADWTIHSAADVWAAATRTLTAGTNIALAKGTGVTGFNDLSAADVRTALGLASANLDTQLDALPTNAELATALAAADDAVLAAIAALNNLSAAQVNAEADTALSDVGVTLARMGALTDWIDGGRLDVILDAIAVSARNRVTKNTALSAFPFKMVDATDGFTAETGITVTATRSLDSAAFGACANAVSEIGSGWYKIDLAAGDLNGNTVILRFTGTGCRTTEVPLVTQPA